MRIERSSVDQVKARFALNKKKLEEKKKDYDLEQRTTEMREEEEKLREYRREKKKDKKRKMEDDHSGIILKVFWSQDLNGQEISNGSIGVFNFLFTVVHVGTKSQIKRI